MSLRALFQQHGLMEYLPAFEVGGLAALDLPEVTEQELRETFGMVNLADRQRFHALVLLLTHASPIAPTPTLTRACTPDDSTRLGAPISGASAPPESSASTGWVDAAGELPPRIGCYRILGLAGTGGMGGIGMVVRARHDDDGWARRQGGDVAIKLIHPHIASGPDFQRRFFIHADKCMRIQHPGLAPVYDVVSDGPWLGTVMGLVLGVPLSQYIVPGGLSVSAVLTLLEPLGAALDHLHSHGEVHCDLKPANVVVRADASTVLIDLGVPNDTHSGSEPHPRTMAALGTSAWIAPEQAEAKHVDSAADRYAFGLLTYALLAGQMPWASDATEARVLTAKLTGQLEPLSLTQPDVGTSVSASVMSMLAVSPSERPPNCVAFLAQLRATYPVAQAVPAKPPEAALPHAGGNDAMTTALRATVPPLPQSPVRKAGDRRLVMGKGQSTFSFDVVYVPPGEFEMGSPPDEPCRFEDEAQHRVRLTRGFEVGVFPVTRALYAAVMGDYSGTLEEDRHPAGPEMLALLPETIWRPSSSSEGEQLSVATVTQAVLAALMGRSPVLIEFDQLPEPLSWFDAVRLCNAVSRACGIPEAYIIGLGDKPSVTWSPSNDGFRLPTESEWEYTARAGARYGHTGGNIPDTAGLLEGDFGDEREALGQNRVNAWGLHDMPGNDDEWCWDWYAMYPTGPVADPTGPTAGERRVIRGGCWSHWRQSVRVATRDSAPPGDYGVGVRLFRTVT